MAILIPNFELAEKIGSKIEIEAGTVDELVRKGIAQFGEPFKKTVQTASIVVNGRNVSLLKGGKTKLGREDSVWLILPSGGG
jgi:molybdopterin converting factor small subunit